MNLFVRVCVCVLKVGDKKCSSDFMERLVLLLEHFRVLRHIICGLSPPLGELFVVCMCVGVTEKPVIWC